MKNTRTSPLSLVKFLIQSSLLIGLFFATSSIAQAATITVNSLATTVANDSQCTLPEAITSANNNSAGTTNCTAGSGADTIVFSVSGTINISGANLTNITSPMTINGGSNIVIDANNTNNRRIFNLTSAANPVTIQNITLQEGRQSNGGCINTAGNISLTITNSTISNCTATSGGGAIYFGDNTNPSLTLTNVSLLNNTAAGNGGAIYADDGTDITATNLTATGNSAPSGSGAVIYYNAYGVNASNVVITGTSNISFNDAPGGAIYIRHDDGHLIAGVTFEGNEAGVSGTSSGNGAAIQTLGNADITISNNNFIENFAYLWGSGGAIEINNAVSAIIENNTFDANESPYGGAIHVGQGNVTIRKNAFLNNEAFDEGGALYLSESGGPKPVISITNNTFDGNIANSDGGGVIRNRAGIATIYNNTFTNNSTPGAGAVILADTLSETSFANNIFDDNSGSATCSVGSPVSWTNQGDNFFDSATGCSSVGSDIIASSANLGSLALNSGTTLNRLPNTGSPVIDVASATYAPADDQRGVSRPQGSSDDMGSVEFDAPADTTAPIIAQVTAVPSPTNDSTPNYTFSSDEAGTITYGGDCSSATTSATVGNNTVTFNSLSDGTHSNCTVRVTDAASNQSNLLNVNSFTIDTAAPIIAQVTAVPTPTADTTPDYTFSSTEVGTITYGGSCSSATTSATVGNNTVTFNTLSAGTYANCTIKVTGTDMNDSNTLNIPSFTIDTISPNLTAIVRASANPSSASTVDFTVTFSESVTGVDVADFVLHTSGTVSANINSVTAGPGVYNVNVNSITGSGTLRLDLADTTSIQDIAGNLLDNLQAYIIQ
ncbi:MAG: choice-of-anchor Q domain-containing protein [Candidatus Altimarinota bacterium]